MMQACTLNVKKSPSAENRDFPFARIIKML